MDISKFKFVVSTGCSYGVVHESFRPNADKHHEALEPSKDWELIEKFKIDGDVISISLGVSSKGAKWQSDSIIYTTKKLLELMPDSSIPALNSLGSPSAEYIIRY